MVPFIREIPLKRSQSGGGKPLFSPACFFAKPNQGGSQGFTMIEMIISLVILSISVIGILQVFGAGLAPRNAPLPVEITTANQLAQEGIERVLADRKNSNRGFGWITSSNYPIETLTGAFIGYIRSYAISAWPGNTDMNLYKQVTVSISHNGTPSAGVTTLVANY